MKVSIVIPLYNVAQYIEDCLSSIIEQNYEGDIECVLVDDCGEDDTWNVVSSFISGYKGMISFVLLRHDKNRGAAAARNTGIDHSTGDYVMFVDGDDWLSKECVAVLVECMEGNSDVQLVQCGIETTDGSIPLFDFEKNPLRDFCYDRYYIKTRLLGRGIIPNSPCGKLLRLSYIRDNRLFFHEGIVMEDELWVNLLAKHIRGLAVINKDLYHYRIREGSVVTSGIGTDPFRKIILYDLMVQAVDEPYVAEQVDYILMLVDKVYFENENEELRKRTSCLYEKMALLSKGMKRYVLYMKSLLAKLGGENSSISYYLFYRLSMLKDILSYTKGHAGLGDKELSLEQKL